MGALFTCEMDYIESQHLSQLYAGFEILQAKGIVDVRLIGTAAYTGKPILKVRINNRYTVIYDTLDGLNWIDGSLTDNLEYFRNHIRADFYFKRSFDDKLIEYAPQNCQVLPLGLNYYITPKTLHKKNIKDSLKNAIRNNPMVARYLKINHSDIFNEEFEYYPVVNNVNRILFLTRLWDPGEVKQDNLKAEREVLNQYRIDCIRLCKKEFGDQFTGGLQQDKFTTGSRYGELVAPYELTKRSFFLNQIKASNICIATTGLHGSIGFKLAEYLAASRAIITEPLNFRVPGNFENGKNYFSFSNAEELVKNISRLAGNRDAISDMMHHNFIYYHNFLRPDMLVLNTLLSLTKG